MSKRPGKKGARPGANSEKSSQPRPGIGKWAAGIAAAVVVLGGAVGAWLFNSSHEKSPSGDPAYKSRPKGSLTYNRDVAPILFQNCAPCHRPGQSAPFSLLTYADAKKRASEIVDVTGRRYMPPWLPAHGFGEFAGERRLSVDQIGILKQWAGEGSVEGNPADLPKPPEWDSDWQLGRPDLVVDLPEYTLPAEGKDIYRNFVVPIPVESQRFVRGVEFRPGNAKVLHHAFINVDPTRRSRRRADKQNPPGFDGMEIPETAAMPGGQFMSWQPGKTPFFSPEGLAWTLRPDTDLVLQAHFNPSGKPEKVKPSVGLYFTDQAPTNTCFRLKLTALNLDIPAGATNYNIRQTYTLPVDVSVIRVGAHSHYLGKDLRGYAILPGGERKELLWIKDWDFKWQGDYGYAPPVALPKGTVVTLDFTFDNSTNNLRNPNRPPKPVRWGLGSADEMAELYFQVLPNGAQDYAVLAKDFSKYFLGVSRDFYVFRINHDPTDAEAHKRLGEMLGYEGKTADAIKQLTEASQLQPSDAETHFGLGNVYLRQGDLATAYLEFQNTARLDPDDSEALGSLGIICLRGRKYREAEGYFERALQINPKDELAKKYLEKLRSAKAP